MHLRGTVQYTNMCRERRRRDVKRKERGPSSPLSGQQKDKAKLTASFFSRTSSFAHGRMFDGCGIIDPNKADICTSWGMQTPSNWADGAGAVRRHALDCDLVNSFASLCWIQTDVQYTPCAAVRSPIPHCQHTQGDGGNAFC